MSILFLRKQYTLDDRSMYLPHDSGQTPRGACVDRPRDAMIC